ncbi:MAG: universal stress protein [Brevundimonas sp.]|nr:universal stress protein [Brevundimonas sp.]
MERILVATDFSTRSDRAVRRAALLARGTGAAIRLLHIVDDDRPEYLVSVDQAAADKALSELCRTIRDLDGLSCDYHLTLGDPFEGIVAAARTQNVDLLIIGPHRRQILRDAFVGTTAERVIRHSQVPILMANGSPLGPYRQVLAASDLSQPSADAVSVLGQLAVAANADLTLFQAIDVPEVGLMVRAQITSNEIRHQIEKREKVAVEELRAFAAGLSVKSRHCIAAVAEGSTAVTILKAAAENNADLIVIGTRGRTGLARFLLGSVTEDVLRPATIDVLVVPPKQADED